MTTVDLAALEGYLDPLTGSDMWVERLPERVFRRIADLQPGDVEYDEYDGHDETITVYREVEHLRDGDNPDRKFNFYRVTYDVVTPDPDDSQWREQGIWVDEDGLELRIEGRVLHLISEEPF